MKTRNIALQGIGAVLLAACASTPGPVVTEETIQRVIRSSYSTLEYRYPPEVSGSNAASIEVIVGVSIGPGGRPGLTYVL